MYIDVYIFILFYNVYIYWIWNAFFRSPWDNDLHVHSSQGSEDSRSVTPLPTDAVAGCRGLNYHVSAPSEAIEGSRMGWLFRDSARAAKQSDKVLVCAPVMAHGIFFATYSHTPSPPIHTHHMHTHTYSHRHLCAYIAVG